MSGKFSLTTPPAFQCYDCKGCGECCRGRFAILISRADRARIETQGWTAEELGLGDRPLFVSHGDHFQLAYREDGSCIFLNEQGLCRIHARFGEPAKPLACRLYPFRFVPLGSQVRVDVRFDCPATASNFGRPVAQYRTALLRVLPDVVPEQAADLPVPSLYGAMPATWAQLCRISETFAHILVNNSADLTRRMLACVNFAALLHSPRIVTLEGRKFSEFLETIANKVVETAATDTLPRVAPPGMVQTAFRQVLGIYGRIDRVGEKAQPMARLRNSLNVIGGRGEAPAFRPDFPQVAFGDIDAMRGTPANGAADALERYYHLRLTSMGFFGRAFYGFSYLDGMNSLLLTYPLINWFARAYAHGAGLDTPNAACMAHAIQIVDHQHGMLPLLKSAPQRMLTNFLAERSHLRKLIIWYGS